MCFCKRWPECGTTGCSVFWQGDSGSKTGPLLLATPPGRSTSMHCNSSSACWLTGRPMGAWDWLASPQASGTKSIRETRLKTKDRNLHVVAQKIRIVQYNRVTIHRKREENMWEWVVRQQPAFVNTQTPPLPLTPCTWITHVPVLTPTHACHPLFELSVLSFCSRRTHCVENEVLRGRSMWY